nr:MAG TPA_asm: hypothetical protein [Bacteriophage sp.]
MKNVLLECYSSVTQVLPLSISFRIQRQIVPQVPYWFPVF